MLKKIILLSAALAVLRAYPVFAEEMEFNKVRININGIDRVQWGEELTLDNGSTTPYSITYNDTTYLPLRKISSFYGKEVEWDGDSRMIYIYSDEYTPDSGYIKPELQSDTFNTAAINIDGQTLVLPNTDYTLDNGSSTPYTIMYNNTTYLPMRQLCSLLGKNIYWNGDSRTVSVTEKKQISELITVKADSYGNVWQYSIFTAYEYFSTGDTITNRYLSVKDNERGFERVYLLADTDIKVTDNYMYFIRNTSPNRSYGPSVSFNKLTFMNDLNSQDGEIIGNDSYYTCGVFDDEYLYYVTFSPGNAQHSDLHAFDLNGSQVASWQSDTWTKITAIGLTQSNEKTAVLSLSYFPISSDPSAHPWQSTRTFYKDEKKFNEPMSFAPMILNEENSENTYIYLYIYSRDAKYISENSDFAFTVNGIPASGELVSVSGYMLFKISGWTGKYESYDLSISITDRNTGEVKNISLNDLKPNEE